MAENKKSFLLYCDIIHTVEKLPIEKAGELFLHILKYVNDQNPQPSDFIIEIAFEPIKQSLKRDLQRWENICERNKNNGQHGGRPKKKPKKPSGLFDNPKNPSEPKKADSDIDIDSDISIINKYKSFGQFYANQIALSNENDKYLIFVKYLYGDNPIKTKMEGVLSIRDQLTFENFQSLLDVCEKNNTSIRDIILKIENDKKYYKDKKVLYTTMLNWAKQRFIK